MAAFILALCLALIGFLIPVKSDILDNTKEYEKKYKANVVKPFEIIVQNASFFVGLFQNLAEAAKHAGEDPDNMKITFLNGQKENIEKMKADLLSTLTGVVTLSYATRNLLLEGHRIEAEIHEQILVKEHQLIRMDYERTYQHMLVDQINQRRAEQSKRLDAANEELKRAEAKYNDAKRAYDNQGFCGKRKKRVIPVIIAAIVCGALGKKKEDLRHGFNNKVHEYNAQVEQVNSISSKLNEISEKENTIVQEINKARDIISRTQDGVVTLKKLVISVAALQASLRDHEVKIMALKTDITTAIGAVEVALIKAGMQEVVDATINISKDVIGDSKTEEQKLILPGLKAKIT